MTHAELVSRAARWLKNSRHCSLVTTRAVLCADEQPDALGFDAHARSILVECKASRSDFFKDANKYFRKFPSRGMGNRRYFLVPRGLVKPDEVPEAFGLLDCHATKIVEVKKAPWHGEKCRSQEMVHLLAQFRARDVIVIPELEPECWADVGL